MNPNLALMIAATFFHDFFTVVWMGGMIILVLVVMPSARSTMDGNPILRKFVAAAESRMRRLAVVSMIALVVTGLIMKRMSGKEGGLFDFSGAYNATLSIKHIAMLLMAAIAFLRTRLAKKSPLTAPAAGSRTGSDKPAGNDQRAGTRSAQLLLANLILGILVLLLSAILASMA